MCLPEQGQGWSRALHGEGEGAKLLFVSIGTWEGGGDGRNSLSSTTCPQKEDYNVPSAYLAVSRCPKAQIIQRGLVGALRVPGDTNWPWGPVCSHLWLTYLWLPPAITKESPQRICPTGIPIWPPHLCVWGTDQTREREQKTGGFQWQWSAHPSWNNNFHYCYFLDHWRSFTHPAPTIHLLTFKHSPVLAAMLEKIDEVRL